MLTNLIQLKCYVMRQKKLFCGWKDVLVPLKKCYTYKLNINYLK